MNDGIDYKTKYLDLKARYINSVDVAYRTGFEEGYNKGQTETQLQQMQMMQQGAQGGQLPPQATQEKSGELDQYIAQLEEAIQKSEPDVSDIKKALEQVKTVQMLKKAQEVSPFAPRKHQTSTGYKNMTHQDRKAIDMQESVVDSIVSKWEQEERAAVEKTHELLNTEILKKASETLRKSLEVK